MELAIDTLKCELLQNQEADRDDISAIIKEEPHCSDSLLYPVKIEIDDHEASVTSYEELCYRNYSSIMQEQDIKEENYLLMDNGKIKEDIDIEDHKPLITLGQSYFDHAMEDNLDLNSKKIATIFTKVKYLKESPSTVSSKKSKVLKTGKFECEICCYKTNNRNHFVAHVRRTHNNDISRDEKTRLYKCDLCQFVSKYKSSIQNHVKYTHNEKSELHKCAYCSFVSKYKNSIYRHEKLSHRGQTKKFECAICCYKTKYKCDLIKHIRYVHHNNSDNLDCTYCDFKTKSKCNLHTHIKFFHKDEKCPNLENDNKATSEDVALYKCAHCPFVSQYTGNISRHVKLNHKKTQIFQCAVCSHQTKRRDHLASHIKHVHNQNIDVHKCPFCEFKTKYKRNLPSHIKYNHNEKELCKYTK